MRPADSPPRILWVGTRSPWPTHDGGRLVAALTIDALADAGAEVLVVTPAGPTAPPRHPGVTTFPCVAPRASWMRAAGRALVHGQPLTVARHLMPAVQRQVAALLATTQVDVVHVEQIQAHAAARPARDAGVPMVLRLHNIESAVWQQTGRLPWRLLMRTEARRLATHEARVMHDVDAVVTLSDADAATAAGWAPRASVIHVPAPAPPPEAQTRHALTGAPACVWLGSPGWPPNDDGWRWLEASVWPAIRAAVPGARLHGFGPPASADATIQWHAPPDRSAEALAPDAVLLLPLRLVAGVRMRVLEAWARGMPVVASPSALAGLSTSHEDDVLVADTPDQFAHAVRRLRDDTRLRARLVAGGHARIATSHEPGTVASRLLEIYADVVARPARR